MDIGFILTVVGIILTILFGVINGVELRQHLLHLDLRYFLSKPKKIEDYFTVIKGDAKSLDYVIYQLGTRSKIPVVDLLYLEYLHYLINTGYIKQVLLVPSPDLSSSDQSKGGLDEFEGNLKKIFKTTMGKVQIIKISSSDTLRPFSKEFLEVIEFVGSNEFIKYVNRFFSKQIKGYCDFNRYHPRERRLLALYSHIITAWTIVRYLRREQKITKDNPVNSGFLIWETELDKLGVYRHYARPQDGLSVTPMLGKTITFSKSFFKEEPLPVFQEKGTVVVFNSTQDIIQRFSKGTHNSSFHTDEFRKYFEILSCILMSNYNRDISFKTAWVEGKQYVDHFQVGKDMEIEKDKYFFAFLYLLNILKEIYSNDQ